MNSQQQLHLAVRENDTAKIEELLKSGVDINCLFYGWTPLQVAINQGLEDLAVYLMEKGSDIHKQHDKNDPSAFESAVKKRQAKVVKELLDRGVDPNTVLSNQEPAIFLTIEDERTEILDVLIEGKADVNILNSQGESPLYTSCREGFVKVCQTLLQAGADPNFVCQEDGDQTPLIVATAHEQNEVVKVLLKHGCDLNVQDGDGWTALWHANSNSDVEMMDLLLKSGASKDIPDADGHSLLDEAKENEDDEVIELLTKFSKSWT
ncbi:hypothetical protein ACJMK2_033157 [Sinanodonta woodiana]|uniref:Uncharacterized protein n=1 Tax=Sinanodonta woodiana TaxID=1069815 RepID=A0ABD3X461_SINWO